MADACRRYNARFGWLSAGALFSRNAHGPITNYAKTKQNVFKGQIAFFSENCWGLRRVTMNTQRENSITLTSLNISENSKGTGLNCQRVGVVNRILAGFLRHIINNLLISNLRPSRENVKL